MSEAEIDAAREVRRTEGHAQFRRPEKRDPWPLIEGTFPRIAAQIGALWGQPQLDHFLARLVIDDRGGRAGFPPDVLNAILEVARLHGERFRYRKPVCPWEHDVRETKWWTKR